MLCHACGRSFPRGERGRPAHRCDECRASLPKPKPRVVKPRVEPKVKANVQVASPLRPAVVECDACGLDIPVGTRGRLPSFCRPCQQARYHIGHRPEPRPVRRCHCGRRIMTDAPECSYCRGRSHKPSMAECRWCGTERANKGRGPSAESCRRCRAASSEWRRAMPAVCVNPSCGKVFPKRPGQGGYCSNACFHASRAGERLAPRVQLVCANPSCGKTFEVLAVYVDRTKTCSRACKNAAARKHADDSARAVASSNRRRARRARVPHEPYTVAQVAERDGNACWLCRRLVDMTLPRTDDWGATVDHIVPMSLGGWDVVENVRLAHNVCNRRRGNRMMVEDLYLLRGPFYCSPQPDREPRLCSPLDFMDLSHMKPLGNGSWGGWPGVPTYPTPETPIKPPAPPWTALPA